MVSPSTTPCSQRPSRAWDSVTDMWPKLFNIAMISHPLSTGCVSLQRCIVKVSGLFSFALTISTNAASTCFSSSFSRLACT